MVKAVQDTGYMASSDAGAQDATDGDDGESAARARERRSPMRKCWFAVAIGSPVMLVAHPELQWLYLPSVLALPSRPTQPRPTRR